MKYKKIKIPCEHFPNDSLKLEVRQDGMVIITIEGEYMSTSQQLVPSEAGIAKLKKFLNQNFDIDGKRKDRT